jgi:hypothetical protein
MLSIQTLGDGARIEGDATDLLALVMLVQLAIKQSAASAPPGNSNFQRIEIVCTEPLLPG